MDIHRTGRTTITRLPRRGSHDRDTINSILDEALFCTLSYIREGTAFQIPTGHVRIDNAVYIHGSVGSFYMRELAAQAPTVTLSATLMDGIVLARSAFHHSVNYRSVVMFSKPEPVTDITALNTILEAFTDKMQPGRWKDVRKPTAGEWKATMVLRLPIEEASAKIRSGAPGDDEEDYALNIWAGVVPLTIQRLTPIPDPLLNKEIPLPHYLKDFQGKSSSDSLV